ncbi:MAG: M28 family metallopeptidase [Lentisphaeria bacterium]|nr:M28 family metallopeptidase [Lentisphaeria bacterium]
MNVIFDGKRAYRHLEVLAKDIGPRHGGSANEAKAAAYIHGFFAELGLRSGYDDYPIYSFEKAEAELTTPDGHQFPCKPFPMTAGTPAEGVTGETVFLEDADAVFLDDGVTGRIVVTFNTFDRAAHDRFAALNPAGLVSIQSAHSQLHVAAPWRHMPESGVETIPSVCMTYSDGLALIEDRPAALTLQSKTTGEGWRAGKNVIADLPGSEPGDEVIIMCAHYDSVWTGPGAFDNGGGTAALMELARVYKEKGSKYTLRFCAFGGEEMGLWGSKSYVQSLRDQTDADTPENAREQTQLNNVRFVINLDMMGMRFGRSNALILGHPDIAASVRLLANRRRYAIGIQEDKIYSSDNKFFNLMGIPSLSFNRMGFANGQGHTAGDTIDNCSPGGIAHIAQFVEAWIDDYLMDLHTFPFPRTLPPSSQKSVDEALSGKGAFAGYDRKNLLKKARQN